MNTPESAITLKELSQLSGFSISTVSKALNDKFDISPTTRKMIKKIAVKYNYVPNNYAVALRKKQTKAIAIIIPRINTTFYSCFLHNIEKVASKYGYRIVLFQSFAETKREKECLKNINDGSVDGVIMLSTNAYKETISVKENILPVEHIEVSETLQNDKFFKEKSISGFKNLLQRISA
ncbi:LacI family DNA-binding transcriptional regulator [Kordia algicida OT-1]|uniref:Transcriptional regulator of the lacI family protein n=1 Tax=Kordia algicida OT-1 TaxID=391587 RepID=A9ECY2_9FLAO|nr:LacI family DNA-binding transcriptional regulator [Kordia algicida]EDP94332.1 transcriptional regulator of the lacI family protein [Kordia algicida OT-1]